jgi:hypothetical protein
MSMTIDRLKQLIGELVIVQTEQNDELVQLRAANKVLADKLKLQLSEEGQVVEEKTDVL